MNNFQDLNLFDNQAINELGLPNLNDIPPSSTWGQDLIQNSNTQQDHQPINITNFVENTNQDEATVVSFFNKNQIEEQVMDPSSQTEEPVADPSTQPVVGPHEPTPNNEASLTGLPLISRNPQIISELNPRGSLLDIPLQPISEFIAEPNSIRVNTALQSSTGNISNPVRSFTESVERIDSNEENVFNLVFKKPTDLFNLLLSTQRFEDLPGSLTRKNILEHPNYVDNQDQQFQTEKFNLLEPTIFDKELSKIPVNDFSQIIYNDDGTVLFVVNDSNTEQLKQKAYILSHNDVTNFYNQKIEAIDSSQSVTANNILVYHSRLESEIFQTTALTNFAVVVAATTLHVARGLAGTVSTPLRANNYNRRLEGAISITPNLPAVSASPSVSNQTAHLNPLDYASRPYNPLSRVFPNATISYVGPRTRILEPPVEYSPDVLEELWNVPEDVREENFLDLVRITPKEVERHVVGFLNKIDSTPIKEKGSYLSKTLKGWVQWLKKCDADYVKNDQISSSHESPLKEVITNMVSRLVEGNEFLNRLESDPGFRKKTFERLKQESIDVNVIYVFDFLDGRITQNKVKNFLLNCYNRKKILQPFLETYGSFSLETKIRTWYCNKNLVEIFLKVEKKLKNDPKYGEDTEFLTIIKQFKENIVVAVGLRPEVDHVREEEVSAILTPLSTDRPRKADRLDPRRSRFCASRINNRLSKNSKELPTTPKTGSLYKQICDFITRNESQDLILQALIEYDYSAFINLIIKNSSEVETLLRDLNIVDSNGRGDLKIFDLSPAKKLQLHLGFLKQSVLTTEDTETSFFNYQQVKPIFHGPFMQTLQRCEQRVNVLAEVEAHARKNYTSAGIIFVVENLYQTINTLTYTMAYHETKSDSDPIEPRDLTSCKYFLAKAQLKINEALYERFIPKFPKPNSGDGNLLHEYFLKNHKNNPLQALKHWINNLENIGLLPQAKQRWIKKKTKLLKNLSFFTVKHEQKYINQRNYRTRFNIESINSANLSITLNMENALDNLEQLESSNLENV